MSSDQQHQETFKFIQQRDQALDKRLQEKYEKRSQTLATMLFSKLAECVNSGKTKQQCEEKYLKDGPDLAKVEESFNQCMHKAFPPNSNTRKMVEKCYDDFETQLDVKMFESLNSLESLLK